MVDPLNYFSFQPVLHNWCNKGHGMCYPVCGMVHIKEPLLLIRKSNPCGGSRFPLSLSEWSFIICQTLYNCKWNVLSASLNKTFPSFLYLVVIPSSVLERLVIVQWVRGPFTCPVPLKVQACPPWDQRLALRSRVSGQVPHRPIELYFIYANAQQRLSPVLYAIQFAGWCI